MTDKSVREPDERLAAYVDGCLADRERERFLAELRVNPQLRADLAEYERTVAAVRAALRAPTQPVDLATRVLAAIAAGAAPAVPAQPVVRRRPLYWSLGAAAALLVIAVALDAWSPAPAPTDLVATLRADRPAPAAGGGAQAPETVQTVQGLVAKDLPSLESLTERPEADRRQSDRDATALLLQAPAAEAPGAAPSAKAAAGQPTAGAPAAVEPGPAGAEPARGQVDQASGNVWQEPGAEKNATGSTVLAPDAGGKSGKSGDGAVPPPAGQRGATQGSDDFYLGAARQQQFSDDKAVRLVETPRQLQFGAGLAVGGMPVLPVVVITSRAAVPAPAVPGGASGAGGPTTGGPAGGAATRGVPTGRADAKDPAGGLRPGASELELFLLAQSAVAGGEPKTTTGKAAAGPAAVQFGGLVLTPLVDAAAAGAWNRGAAIAESQGQRERAVAPLAERLWLVQGTQAEITALLGSVAEHARRAGFELTNGELAGDDPLLRGAAVGTAMRMAGEPAPLPSKPGSPVLPSDAQRPSGGEAIPARVVLRFCVLPPR